MDLIEAVDADAPRHPWERARAEFFTEVAARAVSGRAGVDVLDCGAGDAYFNATLARALAPRSTTCWDASYTPSIIKGLERAYGARADAMTFTTSMPERRFDLILMLDVIEHVEDDVGFVRGIVDRCLEPSAGRVLVSVPAWQPLFSRHDELLKHYRRYAPGACARVLEAAGLRLLERGGLFHSLVLPRALTVLKERAEDALGRARPLAETGAATWGGGVLATRLVDGALRADNRLSVAAARAGLEVPGLTWWALAERR